MSKAISGLSEIEAIYHFLNEYESEFAAIYKDGGKWAAETSGDKHNAYHNGDTIGDAIRNFYSAIESEKAE